MVHTHGSCPIPCSPPQLCGSGFACAMPKHRSIHAPFPTARIPTHSRLAKERGNGVGLVPLLVAIPGTVRIPSPRAWRARRWLRALTLAVYSRLCAALTLKPGLVRGKARLDSPSASASACRMPRRRDQLDGGGPGGGPMTQGSAPRGGGAACVQQAVAPAWALGHCAVGPLEEASVPSCRYCRGTGRAPRP